MPSPSRQRVGELEVWKSAELNGNLQKFAQGIIKGTFLFIFLYRKYMDALDNRTGEAGKKLWKTPPRDRELKPTPGCYKNIQVPSSTSGVHTMGKRLSVEQQEFYHANGYIIGLPPVFDDTEVRELNRGLNELLKLLRPGEDVKEIREWHESSRFLYDICMNETILDHVEDILGPDFYLWGSNFFIKPPHSSSTVGWHQDTYYWPVDPKISATVWLAFEDVDEENAAMRVVPGSHKAGLLKHARSTDTASVLTLELEGGQFREDSATSLNLKAGQISIHDDKIVHGSPANRSDRRRTGLTIRYSSTIVKCDLSVNPHFRTYLCRGIDTYKHNPVGTIPSQKYSRLERKHVSVEEAGVEAERRLGLR